MIVTKQNCVTEWHFQSGISYDDPFNQVILDILIKDPDGTERRVPAFWSGGDEWRVRYSSSKVGTHTWVSDCSDSMNSDLHQRLGTVEVVQYDGINPLMEHGPLKVSDNGRFLHHFDDTPFFWLADTWWMGLCSRLEWPGDFQSLTRDRLDKGFSVIQIVMGLYPDMGWRDTRQQNEAGYPWTANFEEVNPAYYDMADLRIHHLVRNGLMPCIFACWGYYLPLMGVDKMKKFWRYLLARYGAYPVVWCIAGEASFPFYLSENKDSEREFQIRGWTEIASFIKETDPYDRLVTVHPSGPSGGAEDVENMSSIDINMLQTGHADRQSLLDTYRIVSEGYEANPIKPVINGEVTYEGLAEVNRQEVQRFMFWLCMLSGAAGHTYGANGVWQVNGKETPYGKSPGGQSWGDTSWQEASRLPGSTQLGLGKSILERFRWWEFRPRQDWVENPATKCEFFGAYAAGIDEQVRVIYVPGEVSKRGLQIWRLGVKNIEPNICYKASLFNPVDGSRQELGIVEPDSEGNWRPDWSRPPAFQDWILVLETENAMVEVT